MGPEAIGLIITAVSGGLATIIYAFKNIKKSECCGCECEQRVPATPPLSKLPSMKNTSTQTVIEMVQNSDV